MQYLVEKVELSKGKEQLIFHTRDVSDCKSLWSQLYGQLLDITEGRKAIPYEIQEDIPNDKALDIFIDTDQIITVLTYLEVELKFHKFLAPGATAEIQKQLEAIEKTTAVHEEDGVPLQESIVDDRKYSPK